MLRCHHSLMNTLLLLCLPSTYTEPVGYEDVLQQLGLTTEHNSTVNTRLFHLTENAGADRFLLFTRKNKRLGQGLVYGNEMSVRLSNFNASVPTVVVVHGWLGNSRSGLNPTIKEALLDADDVNVIIMDWSRLSQQIYLVSSGAVPAVGRGLGLFLAFLKDVTGMPFSSVHLVGFSLGGHIVGVAARRFNGRIARITALDPAGPLWYLNDERLRNTDAVYVEAIHTNAGLYGISTVVGDVDFFANGGRSQPGCFSDLCNHERAWQLFAASISREHLVGNECYSRVQLFINSCNGPSFPMGNNDLRKFGTGVYRLRTRSRYPY